MVEIEESLLDKVISLGERIGKTPLVEIKGLHKNPATKIWAKQEWLQFGGSVKARPAYNIILQAIKEGDLNQDRELVDASSGNTAIAYASICAALKIKCKIFIPANASESRKLLLKALGAELVFSSPFELTDGAQRAAVDYADRFPEEVFYANQYANDNNWKAHYNHTAEEIWSALNGNIEAFVAGLGTTGTFTGNTRKLRELNPDLYAVEAQPETALHGLEGWKDLETAIIPNFYRADLADERVKVATQKAYRTLKEVAQTNGLLLSPSSAANLTAAIEIADKIKAGNVVTVFADNAEKYSEVLKEIL